MSVLYFWRSQNILDNSTNMSKKQKLNFTENFLLSLKEFTNIISQPVIINKAYWEAVNIEKEKQKTRQKEKKRYYSAIERLSKYGYLTKLKKNKQLCLKLTGKGILKLQRITWKTQKQNKINKKEFCLVIFDIPENKKRIRDLFRRCLYELGFEKLQKSVFISYSDTSQEIKKLIRSCGVDEYVEILAGRKI